MSFDTKAEDRLLLSKAYDAIELCERTNSPHFSSFLNEHESRFLRDNLPKRADVGFFGGYEGAVRVMLGAGAQEYDYPITAVEISYKPEFDLRHRDFLGSLMGLGFRRDSVGDILVEEGRAVVFVRDEVAPYLFSQLEKIGRVGVSLSYADVTDLPKTDECDTQMYTLSSLRLDVFVASVTHLSREKAARLIKTEMVAVDHITRDSVSYMLYEGATVTIRKYGKFVLTGLLGNSRKGKLRVEVGHFR